MNTTAELKDYFCPFCHAKLFRGKVSDFKLVCQECNRLVDSSKLPGDADKEDAAKDQPGDLPELAE